MKLYSTANRNATATFEEAVVRGMADDGGLYMPSTFPMFPREFFRSLGEYSFQETSFRVAKALIEDEIPDEALRGIVDGAISFPAPVHRLDSCTGVLELFHGPTLAFKDFGARFMARTLAYFKRNEKHASTILVATSGDTGSAVAHGFLNLEGFSVVLLYPSRRVSAIQELQLTTVGGNVTALEIDGTFDDCQRLVKQAFRDPLLSSTKSLTSANSINIARLLPQSFYYFQAYAQMPEKDKPVLFSVPSGNFGNLTAGLMAWKMGLPVRRFIAATNVNDVVPKYLATGVFNPAPAIATLSNAMDVGNPNNLPRIVALFGGSLPDLRKTLYAASYTDQETRETIAEVYSRYGYILDPHGAVGYRALQCYGQGNSEPHCGIVLETAHPAKFPDAYDEAMRQSLEVPERLQALLRGTKHSIKLPADFKEFKEFLIAT